MGYVEVIAKLIDKKYLDLVWIPRRRKVSYCCDSLPEKVSLLASTLRLEFIRIHFLLSCIVPISVISFQVGTWKFCRFPMKTAEA